MQWPINGEILYKIMTLPNKIVGNLRDILGNLRDILGNLRDILYTHMPNTRVGDAHISIHIHMYRRAIPLRGIDSLERAHACAGEL